MKTKIMFGIAALLAAVSSCKKPDAGFTADKTEIYIGETVHFYDKDETRKNCDFFYDFGDGTNSETPTQNPYSVYGSNSNPNASSISNRNPSHIYIQTGTYEVTQTVYKYRNKQKGRDKSATARLTITVKPIRCDFAVSDTTCPLSGKIYLMNKTVLPNTLYSYGSFQWSFVNTTNPNSSVVTQVYVPNATNPSLNDAYVTFGSAGYWKVTLLQNNSNGYIPRTMNVRVF
ncbi:MAG TPA: hypothetical protein VN026_05770 [Bacteroidia bacterium]|jgi:hypothetical protein|nr:hypothetical protein [Bacteroidia bacterium]